MARWKRSNTNGRSSSWKPGPWSRTVSVAVVQRDLDRAAWRAPLGGVVEQVGHRPGDPVALAADQRRLESAWTVSSRRAPAGALHRVARRSGRARTSPGSPLGLSRGRARRRRRPAPSARRAPRSRRARSAARSSGESSSSSRISWRLARIVAIGVRSSCEASATRLRCDCTERSSASSVRVERLGQPGQLVAAVTSSRSCSSRSGLAAIDSVWRVKRAIGASAVRATSSPSSAASAIPRRGDEDQQQQLLGEGVVDVGERQRHQSAPRARRPVTSTRRWCPADVACR